MSASVGQALTQAGFPASQKIAEVVLESDVGQLWEILSANLRQIGLDLTRTRSKIVLTVLDDLDDLDDQAD